MLKLVLLLLIVFHATHRDATALPKSYDLPLPNSDRVFNLGPGCRLKLRMSSLMRSTARYDDKYPFGAAGLGIEGLRLPQDRWGLSLHCDHSHEEFVNSGWATLKKDRWQINQSEDNKKLLKVRALRFHELKTVGAGGWAITFDETYGEERFRQRTLVYCVVRIQKAVCGTSDVGYLQIIQKNRRADYTNYALKLLRSLEFMDDVVPEGGNGTVWDSLKEGQPPP